MTQQSLKQKADLKIDAMNSHQVSFEMFADGKQMSLFEQ
jgi:hypothetical protein